MHSELTQLQCYVASSSRDCTSQTIKPSNTRMERGGQQTHIKGWWNFHVTPWIYSKNNMAGITWGLVPYGHQTSCLLNLTTAQHQGKSVCSRLTLEESVADPFVLFSGIAASRLLERLNPCERSKKQDQYMMASTSTVWNVCGRQHVKKVTGNGFMTILSA